MIAAIETESKILLRLLERDVLTRSRLDTLAFEAAMAGVPAVEMLLANDLLSDVDAAQAYADLEKDQSA